MDGHQEWLEEDRRWGPQIAYHHGVMTSCFFPLRDPRKNVWVSGTDRAKIILQGGVIVKGGVPIEAGVPYGPRARLFFAWLMDRAKRSTVPEIELPRSARQMNKELSLPMDGRSHRALMEQVVRLGLCNFIIETQFVQNGESRTSYQKANPIMAFELWGGEWPASITLTDQLHQSLQRHAVPYDLKALFALSNNARAMDLYLWLVRRVYRLERAYAVTWSDLRNQFSASDNMSMARWKMDFRRALSEVKKVYPSVNANEIAVGILLKPSPTVIPQRAALPRCHA
jgi:hypothetical protein